MNLSIEGGKQRGSNPQHLGWTITPLLVKAQICGNRIAVEGAVIVSEEEYIFFFSTTEPS